MHWMRWYAGLSAGLVGPHAVMAGIVVSSATGASGWALAVMVAPVVAWAAMQRT